MAQRAEVSQGRSPARSLEPRRQAVQLGDPFQVEERGAQTCFSLKGVPPHHCTPHARHQWDPSIFGLAAGCVLSPKCPPRPGAALGRPEPPGGPSTSLVIVLPDREILDKTETGPRWRAATG